MISCHAIAPAVAKFNDAGDSRHCYALSPRPPLPSHPFFPCWSSRSRCHIAAAGVLDLIKELDGGAADVHRLPPKVSPGVLDLIKELDGGAADLHRLPRRYVIHVKPGVYDETVIVTSKMKNVTIYGENPTHTIITGKKNFVDGTRTFQTATFAAIGEGFMAMGLTFRNTAGAAKHQAVAIRVQSDRSVFLNCNMEGYQDTLYAQTHRQFYHGCIISGTIDFIFGDAAAIFQNCVLVFRRPLDNQQNIATAQGRIDRHENTAFVLHRCRIQADQTLKPAVKKFRSYLGRPWKEYSRMVIMETEIGDLISPDGYMPWQGDFALKTLSYAEYKNTGPGSETKGRVKWHGVKFIKKHDAKKFTVANFLHGGDWIKKTGAGVHVPMRLGLYEN